jgi:hypothetical protein
MKHETNTAVAAPLGVPAKITTVNNEERVFLLLGDMGKTFVCNIEEFKKCWDQFEDKDGIEVSDKWNGRFKKCSKNSVVRMMQAIGIDYSFLSSKKTAYKVLFNGRTVGAIGKIYDIKTTVKAFSRDLAKQELYNNYEHITGLKFLN